LFLLYRKFVTLLQFIRYTTESGFPDWAKKRTPIDLLLAAVGFLKFGFGALLRFGLLFESLATTSGDLRRIFAGYFFRPTVAKSVDSP